MPAYTVIVVVDAQNKDHAFAFVEASLNVAVQRDARNKTHYIKGVRVSTPDGTRSTEFDIP